MGQGTANPNTSTVGGTTAGPIKVISAKEKLNLLKERAETALLKRIHDHVEEVGKDLLNADQRSAVTLKAMKASGGFFEVAEEVVAEEIEKARKGFSAGSTWTPSYKEGEQGGGKYGRSISLNGATTGYIDPFRGEGKLPERINPLAIHRALSARGIPLGSAELDSVCEGFRFVAEQVLTDLFQKLFVRQVEVTKEVNVEGTVTEVTEKQYVTSGEEISSLIKAGKTSLAQKLALRDAGETERTRKAAADPGYNVRKNGTNGAG